MRNLATINRRLLVKLGIGIFAAILPFILFQKLEVLKGFELRVLSFLTYERGIRSLHDDIILITLDDATVAKLGSPLPRQYYAKLIKELNQYAPKAIAFDILFTEPRDPIADDSLAAVSQKYDNVIHAFQLDVWDDGNGDEPNGFVDDSLYAKFAIHPKNEEIMKLFDADAALFPALRFVDAFKSAGMITLMVDADDRFQKLPLIFKYRDKTYPSLSLVALCKYFDIPADSISFHKSFSGYQIVLNTTRGVYAVPIDGHGRMHLNFYGPFESFKSYSILQVLEALQDIRDRKAPRVPLRNMEDKIVIIGAAETANKDSYVTPFSADFPGMGIFATAVSNFLNGDGLRQLPWYVDAGVVLILVLVLYGGFVLGKMIFKIQEDNYAWLLFGVVVLVFNLAAYFIFFKVLHLAPAMLKINSTLILLFLATSFYDKSLSVKILNREVLRLESEIKEKLSHIDILSTRISSQDEQYKIMEFFTGEIERILNNPSVDQSHPLATPLLKLLENQKIIKNQLEDELRNLRTEKTKLEHEKEKLEFRISVYTADRLAPGKKPEPPARPEPPTVKFEEAKRVMEIYKAFLRKQKKGYHVDLPTGMVTAVVADQASGEGDKIKMQEVLAQIARYSAHDSTVLITGENGTGKELVARAICQLSSRKNSPFVDLNCAAIPETLIESELFGHVRGAFTNAISDRAGAFEQADGGIIFLDEIGDLKPELQAKLLRVLQEKKVRRVGSNRSVEVNVRVITATNRDLQKLIEEGKFRIDLYFRLNVANIHLPPLRERKEDIPHLIHYFLDNFNKNEQGRKHLTEEALIAMICYDWPGNIRELQNIVERLCIDALEDTIQLKDLPAEIQESYHAATKGMPLWEIIEAATQAEMKHLMTVCQDILRLGNGEEAPPSGRLEIHGKACENCYDYITTFIDSQASVFPQDKREKLAKQVIVAMKEELFAWCKDEALGKMEQLCEKIEKLLGRTRRMIDNWKREVGFPLFYSPQ